MTHSLTPLTAGVAALGLTAAAGAAPADHAAIETRVEAVAVLVTRL